jgi:hypothetical protein
MKKKARNWMIAILILAFPFVLFFGCLVFMEEPMKSESNQPQKTVPQDSVTRTNMVYSPR